MFYGGGTQLPLLLEGVVSIETLVLRKVVEYNRVIWYYQLS